jgi:hypothetical protein
MWKASCDHTYHPRFHSTPYWPSSSSQHSDRLELRSCCWGGALWRPYNFTQIHSLNYSSVLTICFQSRGSTVRVPLSQWNWIFPVSAVSQHYFHHLFDAREALFVFILLFCSSEDSAQSSAIADGSLSKNWQFTVGWKLCQKIRTQDCRSTVWSRCQRATTTPKIIIHYENISASTHTVTKETTHWKEKKYCLTVQLIIWIGKKKRDMCTCSQLWQENKHT